MKPATVSDLRVVSCAYVITAFSVCGILIDSAMPNRRALPGTRIISVITVARTGDE